MQQPLKPLYILLAFLCISFIQGNRIVEDFSLKNTDGKLVSLNQFPNAKGFIIVFTCNHCPFAKLYPTRLNALHLKYAAQQVPLIAINSVDTTVFDEDRYKEMVAYATENRFTFPYLYDNTQNVAKNFRANKTPHAFVVWKVKNQWTIKYNGAIDDNGAEPEKVTRKYVEEAVDALLQGKEVSTTETSSIGCRIKLRN